MRATRYLVERFMVDGFVVESSYADLYVVVREGNDGPGNTDWEAQVHGVEHRELVAGRHHVAFHIADGSVLSGEAIVRFSDGSRHLFRGDSELEGLDVPA